MAEENGSEAQNGAAHQALVRRFFDDLQNGKWQTVREIMTEDVVRVCPRLTATGVDEVERAGREDIRAFRDFTMEITHLMADGNFAAARLVIRGIHVRDYAKIKPMNRRLALPTVYFFEIKGSLISRLEVYYDIQLLVSQLNTGEIIFLR